MKSSLKLSLIAGVMLVAGLAYAQPGMRGQCDPMMGPGAGMHGQGMHHGRMGNMDPAKMQGWTPAQESAWTAFTDASKLPAGMAVARPDPAELAKLSTPERLDKMKALRAQRMSEMTAAMDKHAEAVKTFYAVLTPEQQKVFDANAMQGPGRHKGSRMGMQPMPPKQ